MGTAYIGLFIFFLIMYITTEEKLKKKTAEYNKLKRKTKEQGGYTMSKMITDLVGKKCNMHLDNSISGGLKGYFGAGPNIGCEVLEADDEWVKISYRENPKKDNSRMITAMVKVEDIQSVEIL